MKRAFDFLLSLTLLIGLTIPMLMIAMAIKLTSSGPALYWSNRVGQENALFRMPKFRTMRIDTPAVATHLLKDPSRHLTPIGGFLRRMSLDEIPQLWSILRGHMSFVGPRAALFNQADLIELRTQKGIHRIVPGLTGWAQINGRDLISIPVKVDCDEFYLKNQSFWLDMKIILRTLLKVLMSDSVAH
ncbi:MAG: sugar transferase [Gemmatimonadetes bacterium]|nr:sugar transferase [Gemmatimonadota bacterium]